MNKYKLYQFDNCILRKYTPRNSFNSLQDLWDEVHRKCEKRIKFPYKKSYIEQFIIVINYGPYNNTLSKAFNILFTVEECGTRNYYIE